MGHNIDKSSTLYRFIYTRVEELINQFYHLVQNSVSENYKGCATCRNSRSCLSKCHHRWTRHTRELVCTTTSHSSQKRIMVNLYNRHLVPARNRTVVYEIASCVLFLSLSLLVESSMYNCHGNVTLSTLTHNYDNVLAFNLTAQKKVNKSVLFIYSMSFVCLSLYHSLQSFLGQHLSLKWLYYR